MADLTTLNSQFLISLSIIFIGWMLRHARIIEKEGGKSLVRIIFNVTLPSLILRMFTRIQMDFAMIVMPLLAFLITGVVFSAALFIHNKEPVKQRRGQFIISMNSAKKNSCEAPLRAG